MSRTRFISAGYFIAARGPAMYQNPYVPAWIWSPSQCISTWYPDWCGYTEWPGDPSEIEPDLRRVGLGVHDLERIQTWVDVRTQEGLIGAPYPSFRDLTLVREFASTFLKDTSELKLLGIGLAEHDVNTFRDTRAREGLRRSDFLGLGIEMDLGTPLGYEPLGYEWDQFHSYLCSELEVDCAEQLGLRINEYGRFDDYESCAAAVRYVSIDANGAEPALWQSWRVDEYPLA